MLFETRHFTTMAHNTSVVLCLSVKQSFRQRHITPVVKDDVDVDVEH